MSIGICRVQKISAPKDIAGIQIHNRRERTHSNTNPDIDHSRSNQNHTVGNVPPADKSYNELIDERIRQGYKGKKAVRKDAVRLCEVLFTASGDFFDQHPEKAAWFFNACYSFAVKRFGEENIIAATVHMDEETPHMHLDFVPLTADGRLSAKSVLGGRKEMQQLQDDFYEQVGRQFGLERGSRADLDAPDEEQPRKHLTTRELKAATAAQIAEQEQQIAEKGAELTALEQSIQKQVEQLQAISAELDTLEDAQRKAVLTANDAEQQAIIAEDRAQSADKRAETAEIRLKNAESKLAEVNAQYEAAAKELGRVLDKKARASEIHKLGNIFGETVQYHKNMLESTRAIGSEAYDSLHKALKALEDAKALEARMQAMQEQIEPLREQAQADRDAAARMRRQQEKLIESRAAEIADKRINAMFGTSSDSRSKRLERFCEELRFNDGSTALEVFEEQEKRLRAKNKGVKF